jgi:hypothetical protein
LQGTATSGTRRLLRVLQLRFGEVSAGPGGQLLPASLIDKGHTIARHQLASARAMGYSLGRSEDIDRVDLLHAVRARQTSKHPQCYAQRRPISFAYGHRPFQ